MLGGLLAVVGSAGQAASGTATATVEAVAPAGATVTLYAESDDRRYAVWQRSSGDEESESTCELEDRKTGRRMPLGGASRYEFSPDSRWLLVNTHPVSNFDEASLVDLANWVHDDRLIRDFWNALAADPHVPAAARSLAGDSGTHLFAEWVDGGRGGEPHTLALRYLSWIFFTGAGERYLKITCRHPAGSTRFLRRRILWSTSWIDG